MGKGWLAVIICVCLAVIFIVFAENSLACHRWWQRIRPLWSKGCDTVHVGFCGEKLPTGHDCAGGGGGSAGHDVYTAATGIGVVGGVLSGSAPVEANPAAARDLSIEW